MSQVATIKMKLKDLLVTGMVLTSFGFLSFQSSSCSHIPANDLKIGDRMPSARGNLILKKEWVSIDGAKGYTFIYDGGRRAFQYF